jgi:PAS domain S-box-containing protein
MHNVEEKDSVTSAEITRNFGYWQERAQDRPLTITHHGRPRYVLVSHERWQEVSQAEHGEQPNPDQGTLEFALLMKHMDGGLVIIDNDLKVIQSSSEATLLLGHARGEVIGRRIDEILPQVGCGPAIACIRHVSRTGEETHFELPGETPQHPPLRIKAFLWPNGVALIVRVFHDRNFDKTAIDGEALERACAAHGYIATIKLTVRATIAQLDARFAALTGLAPGQLKGTRFADLIVPASRAAVREAIEVVLEGSAPSRAFGSKILTNAGVEVPVRISITPIASGFAISGAIMLITTTSD